MGAREIIASAVAQLEPGDGGLVFAEKSIAALHAAGYRIIGPDEIDRVTVEKCAAVADDHAKAWGPAMASPATVIATAIRSLRGSNV
ncbi:MAG: hypothetical protein AB7I42_25180 [Bradyrhizobium sp.]|uniref:hypothetical protein n=1 Tax=Bradyrhizobium sp. TaxID=376 RepID=UPI003D09948F